MYERAYLDDMRALRNGSVDVYPRASDYIDEVVSQIERLQQAGATPSGRAARRTTGRDRLSLGRFDENQVAAVEPLRDRACLVDLGVRLAARILDGLDVSAGHSPSRGLLVAVQFGGQPAREVAVDAVLVRERLDTVQALGRQPPRPYVHVAARVELARHGLTDQAGLRCVHPRTVPQQCSIASVRP